MPSTLMRPKTVIQETKKQPSFENAQSSALPRPCGDNFSIDFVARLSVCYLRVDGNPNVPATLSLALLLPCQRYVNFTQNRYN